VQDAFLRLIDATPDDAVRFRQILSRGYHRRLSLNRPRDQRARRETYIGEWLPEPIACRLKASAIGSSRYATRAILIEESPSLDAGENYR
jgi:hypothetical protein